MTIEYSKIIPLIIYVVFLFIFVLSLFNSLFECLFVSFVFPLCVLRHIAGWDESWLTLFSCGFSGPGTPRHSLRNNVNKTGTEQHSVSFHWTRKFSSKFESPLTISLSRAWRGKCAFPNPLPSPRTSHHRWLYIPDDLIYRRVVLTKTQAYVKF